jgi:hypothetical protein
MGFREMKYTVLNSFKYNLNLSNFEFVKNVILICCVFPKLRKNYYTIIHI